MPTTACSAAAPCSKSPSKSSISKDDWLRDLGAPMSTPGYWTTLEENTADWARAVKVAPFWMEAQKRLKSWNAEYLKFSRVELVSHSSLPEFVGKKLPRLQNKAYTETARLLDDNPKAGAATLWAGGPIPGLNDMVRTRVVCQYLDGVKFLACKLRDLAQEMDRNPTYKIEGRLVPRFCGSDGVETSKLHSGLLGGELPVHGLYPAALNPGVEDSVQLVDRADPLLQTGATHHR